MCSVPHNTFLYYAHTTQYGLVPQCTRSWGCCVERLESVYTHPRIVHLWSVWLWVVPHAESLVLLCAGRGSLLSLDFTSENVIRYPSHVALYLVPYGARRPSHHPSVTRR